MKTADLTEQTKSLLFTVICEWQNLKGSLFDNLKLTYYLFWDFKSPIKLFLSSMQPNCKLKTGIFSVGLMQMSPTHQAPQQSQVLFVLNLEGETISVA